MEELTASKPIRPLDPSLRGNDLLAQTSLLHLVNNPNLQDPQMSAADKLEQQQSAAMLAEAMGGPSPEEQAAQAAANPNLKRKKNSVAPPAKISAPASTPSFNTPSDTSRMTTPSAKTESKESAVSFETKETNSSPTPESSFGAPESPSNATKIFFTGRSGSGKSFLAEKLGAEVLEFDFVLGALWLGPTPSPAEYARLLAWANGVYSEQYPNTLDRVHFVHYVRGLSLDLQEFGSANFLVKYLLERAAASRAAVVAVTDVQSAADYKLLQDAGFTPYHVVASQTTMQTRNKRQRDERLAVHMDGQALAKVQREPQGGKIPVVWSDPSTVVFSSRFYTVDEFVNQLAPVASEPVTGITL